MMNDMTKKQIETNIINQILLKIDESYVPIDVAYDREFTVNIHLENTGEIEDKLYFDEDDENGL